MTKTDWVTAIVLGLGRATLDEVCEMLPFMGRGQVVQSLYYAKHQGRVGCERGVWVRPVDEAMPRIAAKPAVNLWDWLTVGKRMVLV